MTQLMTDDPDNDAPTGLAPAVDFPRRPPRQIVIAAAAGAAGALVIAAAATGWYLHLSEEPTSPPAATAPTTTAPPTTANPDLPALNGVYEIVHEPENAIVTPPSDAAMWGTYDQRSTVWEFTSNCTPKQCVATGTKLNGLDDLQASPQAPTTVMRFDDGAWRNLTPQLTEPSCGVARVQLKETIWFAPHPDGKLRGEITMSVEPGECGIDEPSQLVTPVVVIPLKTGRNA